MKTNWKAKKLSALVEVQNGYAFDSKQFSASVGIPLIRIRDLKVGIETETRFTGKFDEKYIVKPGDFLIGMDGEFGCYEWKGRPALLNQRVCRLQGFIDDLSPRFLFYGVNSYLKEIEDATGYTTVKHLSSRQILDINFPLPPLQDQHRVVRILDEALDGIATAKTNAEKNLRNASGLFDSHLQSVFTQQGEESAWKNPDRQTTLQGECFKAHKQDGLSHASKLNFANDGGVNITKTGGRDATLRHIPGRFALAVGMPKTASRKGWRWSPLTQLARLESGHTPSRKHPEYWGGSVPWIGIQDAREHHGCKIEDTSQHTNELGIANSSARILPPNTVCLSRTASVGYVVVMARPMATSQDFVNWVCSDELNPDFLKYLFLAEGRQLLRFASGAVHQTIYFPEAKAFHICHPSLGEQLRVVSELDSLRKETQRLESVYQRKVAALDALQQSLLHHAFTGHL
ncbi:restriction endonuclease subunit S [Nitrospira sp. Nam74]